MNVYTVKQLAARHGRACGEALRMAEFYRQGADRQTRLRLWSHEAAESEAGFVKAAIDQAKQAYRLGREIVNQQATTTLVGCRQAERS